MTESFLLKQKMHGIGYKGNLNTSAADVKNCNSDALDASQEDKRFSLPLALFLGFSFIFFSFIGVN